MGLMWVWIIFVSGSITMWFNELLRLCDSKEMINESSYLGRDHGPMSLVFGLSV